MNSSPVVAIVSELYHRGMTRFRALGLSFTLPFVLLGCLMENPAFEDDVEFGDDAVTDESTTRDDDESESSDSKDTSTESTSTDDATSTSTSDDTTSETTDTDESESETGLVCGEGLTDCQGSCVDVDTDPQHCGDCESVCAENELCVGTCSLKKHVFVSSEPISGGMGGILGADEFCNELALQAGLPGDYLAWNSTDGSYPNFDFVKEGVYIRTDGHIVATSYEDLTNGSLAMPISVDESGFEIPVLPLASCPNVSGAVWSNTTPFGEYAGGFACTGWIAGNNLITGKIGKLIAIDGSWSDVPGCNVPCGAVLPIYCVQQNP